MLEDKEKPVSSIQVDEILLDKEVEKPIRDQLKHLRKDVEQLYTICRNLRNRVAAIEQLASGEEEEFEQ